MDLYCPACDTTTFHLLGRWQTAPSIWGGVSTYCETCGRLEIHTLGKGQLIQFADDDPVSTGPRMTRRE